jgi:hypothetical protein
MVNLPTTLAALMVLERQAGSLVQDAESDVAKV